MAINGNKNLLNAASRIPKTTAQQNIQSVRVAPVAQMSLQEKSNKNAIQSIKSSATDLSKQRLKAKQQEEEQQTAATQKQAAEAKEKRDAENKIRQEEQKKRAEERVRQEAEKKQQEAKAKQQRDDKLYNLYLNGLKKCYGDDFAFGDPESVKANIGKQNEIKLDQAIKNIENALKDNTKNNEAIQHFKGKNNAKNMTMLYAEYAVVDKHDSKLFENTQRGGGLKDNTNCLKYEISKEWKDNLTEKLATQERARKAEQDRIATKLAKEEEARKTEEQKKIEKEKQDDKEKIDVKKKEEEIQPIKQDPIPPKDPEDNKINNDDVIDSAIIRINVDEEKQPIIPDPTPPGPTTPKEELDDDLSIPEEMDIDDRDDLSVIEEELDDDLDLSKTKKPVGDLDDTVDYQDDFEQDPTPPTPTPPEPKEKDDDDLSIPEEMDIDERDDLSVIEEDLSTIPDDDRDDDISILDDDDIENDLSVIEDPKVKKEEKPEEEVDLLHNMFDEEEPDVNVDKIVDEKPIENVAEEVNNEENPVKEDNEQTNQKQDNAKEDKPKQDNDPQGQGGGGVSSGQAGVPEYKNTTGGEAFAKSEVSGGGGGHGGGAENGDDNGAGKVGTDGIHRGEKEKPKIGNKDGQESPDGSVVDKTQSGEGEQDPSKKTDGSRSSFESNQSEIDNMVNNLRDKVSEGAEPLVIDEMKGKIMDFATKNFGENKEKMQEIQKQVEEATQPKIKEQEKPAVEQSDVNLTEEDKDKKQEKNQEVVNEQEKDLEMFEIGGSSIFDVEEKGVESKSNNTGAVAEIAQQDVKSFDDPEEINEINEMEEGEAINQVNDSIIYKPTSEKNQEVVNEQEKDLEMFEIGGSSIFDVEEKGVESSNIEEVGAKSESMKSQIELKPLKNNQYGQSVIAKRNENPKFDALLSNANIDMNGANVVDGNSITAIGSKNNSKGLEM